MSESSSQRGPRILICEDEEAVRTFVSRGLELAGYRVKSVGDLESALSEVGDSAYDMMITDVSLPDGDGLDLARKVCGQRPDMKIAVISGYLAGGDRLEELEDIVHRLIPKPFTLDDLRTAVAETLAM